MTSTHSPSLLTNSQRHCERSEDSMGVDSGRFWRQTEVASPLNLEMTDVARSFTRRTSRYPHAVWRNFRFVGTEPIDLAGDVAFARERREDVQTYRRDGGYRRAAGAVF